MDLNGLRSIDRKLKTCSQHCDFNGFWFVTHVFKQRMVSRRYRDEAKREQNRSRAAKLDINRRLFDREKRHRTAKDFSLSLERSSQNFDLSITRGHLFSLSRSKRTHAKGHENINITASAALGIKKLIDMHTTRDPSTVPIQTDDPGLHTYAHQQ